jgi:hypothetical protein
MLLDETIHGAFHPLLENSTELLVQLVMTLKQTNNTAQFWTSPLVHALYVFTCSKTPSDQDAYPLKDASKFPSHYLWLLWSTRWTSSDDQGIWHGIAPLCDLMSRAITDPTSNYRSEDAILSVEHFVASSGVIGEAELQVFFGGLTYYERWYSSFMDDPARLLFFASLTLKLCQRSNVSMPKIFSLLMDAQERYGSFRGKGRLLCIFPLLHSLSLKTAPLGDNTIAHASETALGDEVSPEVDTFIDDFCSVLGYISSSYEDASQGILSTLSVLPVLGEPHLLVKQIIRRSEAQGRNDVLRRAFKYCDKHGESTDLHPLTMFTSDPAADGPTREKQAQLIPQLSKQLNELDGTFQLPEGPYTFEHERQARRIMEAAYSEYTSSNVTPGQPWAIASEITTPPLCATNDAVQEVSGHGGTAVGPDDAVIDITLPVDSEKASGGDIDNSEVAVDNEQPEIP